MASGQQPPVYSSRRLWRRTLLVSADTVVGLVTLLSVLNLLHWVALGNGAAPLYTGSVDLG